MNKTCQSDNCNKQKTNNILGITMCLDCEEEFNKEYTKAFINNNKGKEIMNNKEEFQAMLDIATKAEEKDYKNYLEITYKYYMEKLDPKVDQLLEWYKTSDDRDIYEDIIRDLLFKLYLDNPKEAVKFILDDYNRINIMDRV